MVLPYQHIKARCLAGAPSDLIFPFHEKTVHNGKTFGASESGYDIRIRQDVVIWPSTFGTIWHNWWARLWRKPERPTFALASAMEHFNVPYDLMFMVADKSSWAREGLAVQNTIGEPGWHGFLTLELTNHGPKCLRIKAGTAIAQIIFHKLDEPTERPYDGKYQGQVDAPVPSIYEFGQEVIENNGSSVRGGHRVKRGGDFKEPYDPRGLEEILESWEREGLTTTTPVRMTIPDERRFAHDDWATAAHRDQSRVVTLKLFEIDKLGVYATAISDEGSRLVGYLEGQALKVGQEVTVDEKGVFHPVPDQPKGQVLGSDLKPLPKAKAGSKSMTVRAIATFGSVDKPDHTDPLPPRPRVRAKAEKAQNKGLPTDPKKV